jgi:hypothetical protein
LLAAVYGLSMVLPGWLAALIVGGVLAVISGAMVVPSAKKLQKVDPTPKKTMRSVEENVQWAKQQMK